MVERDGMNERTENLYDLLSGFYILLWAQLDSLSDEHRWARAPYDEPEAPRTPAHILYQSQGGTYMDASIDSAVFTLV